jgi:hypothetical protein
MSLDVVYISLAYGTCYIGVMRTPSQGVLHRLLLLRALGHLFLILLQSPHICFVELTGRFFDSMRHPTTRLR